MECYHDAETIALRSHIVSIVQIVTIDEDRDGQRLDNFLLYFLKGVPKSWVYRVIRKGEVRINGKRAKPLTHVQTGDLVRIPPVRTAVRAADAEVSQSMEQQLTAAVIMEDDAMMVINKPSGLAVHGGSGVSLGLIESIRQVRDDLRYVELVHRLDKDTSGCVMLAKKRGALKQLQNDIKQKVMKKNYLCLVAGRWPTDCDRVTAPLEKFSLPSGERMVQVTEGGKKCLTLFKVLKRYANYTLLQASPVTGRTHQIRVHCQFMRCPIVGDVKYCPDDLLRQGSRDGFDRLFLHAESLEFNHPVSGEKYYVSAPLDQRLETPLLKLVEGELS